MHQFSRTPPVRASPWANSPREDDDGDRRSPNRAETLRRDSDAADRIQQGTPPRFGNGSENPQTDLQSSAASSPSSEAKARLSQIVQNYFIKAALIIVQSRMVCPSAYNKNGNLRINKWFNVEIDETDIFREDWRLWRNCDAEVRRPPPMIIETFLDASGLSKNQALVAIDDQERRWNVADALDRASPRGRAERGSPLEVLLERWEIQLGQPPFEEPADLSAILPMVYKKSIVLFRSLFTYSKFLPSWQFARRLAKQRSPRNALQIHCRMIDGRAFDISPRSDPLSLPLFEDDSHVTDSFSFGATDSPAGPFSVKVSYRTACDFRVDDSDSLISSQFIGVDDEQLFRPSIDSKNERYQSSDGRDAGSLPSSARRAPFDQMDRSQAYGSLSTFHQVGPATGTSPLSTLRAARELGGDSPSPPMRVPPKQRSAQGSRSSLRSTEVAPEPQRRPSVSFQPFKSPSYSASPSTGNQLPSSSSPRFGQGRTTTPASALAQARARTSLEIQGPPQSRPTTSSPEALAPSSASGSPKPAPVTRYSSSFGHRRGRLSSGAGSKTEEENNSSGKGSAASSSAQPSSDVLNEPSGGGASSSSMQTDDENISEFLKMLDTKKNLMSFDSSSSRSLADNSTRQTSAALSRFRRMRESNAALSDSLSSSVMLPRSSSSSSRQLSSVPPMVPATSTSTSSSPGKPISPHTPHTPAIPSRLSANSIVVDYQQQEHQDDTHPRDESTTDQQQIQRIRNANPDDLAGDGTTAIDIPLSPRPFLAHARRSSSVAQPQRNLAIEDETGDLLPFGMRSASLGAEDRPPLSLSALIHQQDSSEAQLPAAPGPSENVSDSHTPQDTTEMSRQRSSSFESREESIHRIRGSARGDLQHASRPSLARSSGSGRGHTPPHASFAGPSVDRTSGTGSVERPAGGRYSFSRAHHFDEDDLLFAMSDLHLQGRRSLEEGRRGSGSGISERAVPPGPSSGPSRSGSSAHRSKYAGNAPR